MRFYSTQYRLQDPLNEQKRVLYHSCIYAASYACATQLALVRKIGEMVVGVIESSDFNPCPLPSEFYTQRKMMDCLHTLTFYGWIGTSSGTIDQKEILSDVGLVHEVVHEMHHPDFYGFREEILTRIQNFETKIPGLKTYIHPITKSIGNDSVETFKGGEVTLK